MRAGSNVAASNAVGVAVAGDTTGDFVRGFDLIGALALTAVVEEDPLVRLDALEA
jgi:hypothetical protein